MYARTLTFLTALVASTAATLAGTIAIPIDFAAACNDTVQTRVASFPLGHCNLGGVPFYIPTTGPNSWNALNQSGSNPILIDVPVNMQGALEVHTLINTIRGQAGPTSYARIEFFGSLGAYYSVDLVGNSDIRDYNQYIWTNAINGTTTVNVLDTGQVRVDKQKFILPSTFATQALSRIRLSDSGGPNTQRCVLQGVSVVVNTPPADFYTTLSLSAVANARLQGRDTYPTGVPLLGGVPFDSAATGDNIWYADLASGPNPRTITLTPGTFGVRAVHTLLSTAWGQPGPASYARVEFTRAGGETYTVNLVGGVDIRDWYNGSFVNTTTSPRTSCVYSNGPNRLDKQRFDLPLSFHDDTLSQIRFVDNGGSNFCRLLVQGVTLVTDQPAPAELNGRAFQHVQCVGGITWDHARALAQERGGDLASIDSAQTNTFAFGLLGANRASWYQLADGRFAGPWLGAEQVPGSAEPAGGWEWLGGAPFDYTNWASGEPNNDLGTGNEQHVHFYSIAPQPGPTWNDFAGSRMLRGFIMETGTCIADFNQDGGVDGGDIDAFFAAWEAGDASADANRDGGVDGGDIDAFFAAWEAGGC